MHVYIVAYSYATCEPRNVAVAIETNSEVVYCTHISRSITYKRKEAGEDEQEDDELLQLARKPLFRIITKLRRLYGGCTSQEVTRR